ncbi:MAG: hypothetical protein PHQ23_12445 [Candidatus Wallbacteria bacterium]|nr:hypothetical protein [Candidatus Wallbacteria bacterium]
MSGQLEQAYALGTEEFRSGKKIDRFQAILRELQDRKNLSVSWSFWQFQSDRGVIKGSISLPDGKTWEVSLDLLKISDIWQVSDFTLIKSGG